MQKKGEEEGEPFQTFSLFPPLPRPAPPRLLPLSPPVPPFPPPRPRLGFDFFIEVRSSTINVLPRTTIGCAAKVFCTNSAAVKFTKAKPFPSVSSTEVTGPNFSEKNSEMSAFELVHSFGMSLTYRAQPGDALAPLAPRPLCLLSPPGFAPTLASTGGE